MIDERSGARYRRRPPPPRSGVRWLAGAGVVALALLAFLQARLLVPWLLERRDGPAVAIEEVNLPEREITVFVAGEDPALLLKTPMDLPEADRRQAEDLDRALFPGGERHRYWVLHARHEGEDDVALDVDRGEIVLSGRDGEIWRPVDLREVIRSRAAEIPPFLLVWLRLRVPGEESFTLRPDGGRQLLLAFPEAASPEDVALARVGPRELAPRQMAKDALDRLLDRREDDGDAERP